MYRSRPIPMIQGNNQLSIIKLAVCYQYSELGAKTNGSGALRLKVYGINKSGNDNLIAICPLETKTGYPADGFASSVITGIPVIDYNAIYFTYDVYEVGFTAPKFKRIIKQPIMFVEARELSDILDTNSTTSVGA